MLFAIKYETNKRGLRVANMTLKRYDSAIMFSGQNTGIFFTNPIVALKVSHHLNEVNKHLTYKVYKLTKEEADKIEDSAIVSTYEEYRTLADKQSEAAMKKLEDLRAKQLKETQETVEDEKSL
ncbi:MAG: hypothetical protein E7379_04005 [Clostridiales bacterium]|nr:hypothetical protein [Clostridiales bacterium]